MHFPRATLPAPKPSRFSSRPDPRAVYGVVRAAEQKTGTVPTAQDIAADDLDFGLVGGK
jgi:hypothetical protein